MAVFQHFFVDRFENMKFYIEDGGSHNPQTFHPIQDCIQLTILYYRSVVIIEIAAR